jgi:hypothetical protein
MAIDIIQQAKDFFELIFPVGFLGIALLSIGALCDAILNDSGKKDFVDILFNNVRGNGKSIATVYLSLVDRLFKFKKTHLSREVMIPSIARSGLCSCVVLTVVFALSPVSVLSTLNETPLLLLDGYF